MRNAVTGVARVLSWALLSATASMQAQADFSGDWILMRDRSSQTFKGSAVISVTGLLGDSFTAAQDAKTLNLVIRVPGREVRAVYRLDGSESRNLNPGAPGQPDEPIYSRVSWDAGKLVIMTRGTRLINGKPVETRRTIWLDDEGRLTIERNETGAPTLRSVYRRAQMYYSVGRGDELHR